VKSDTLEQFVLAALVGGMIGFAHRAALRMREARRTRELLAGAVPA
jgi:hypothetical protein